MVLKKKEKKEKGVGSEEREGGDQEEDYTLTVETESLSSFKTGYTVTHSRSLWTHTLSHRGVTLYPCPSFSPNTSFFHSSLT